MKLRKLTLQDESAFLAGAHLWPSDQLFWYTFEWKPGESYAAMLETLAHNEQGLDLPSGRVPNTMLYGFNDDGEIVGRLHIRHRLNEKLRLRGGHIGYAVAPRYRRKGYGTEILRQGLAYARDVLNIREVLLTCADDNAGSSAMIEKAGGRLDDRAFDAEAKEMIRRYWILV